MQLKTLMTTALVASGLMAGGAAQAQAQEKLTVWWVKGFYKAEDEALFEATLMFLCLASNFLIASNSASSSAL